MRFLIGIISLFLVLSTNAQEIKSTETGISLQAYPAGLITTVLLNSSQDDINYFRGSLGVNLTNRKDFSPYNEFEKGKGIGGSFGYRKHINKKSGYIFIGPSLDLWNMWIDWQENIDQPSFEQGRTYTLVIQPWVELGYIFKLGQSNLNLGASTGFGREINVITNGEDVGQGWMNSICLYIQYRLSP